MGYSSDWIDRDEDFADLGPAWDALTERGHTPFDLHRWYRAWWKAFGAGRRLAICVVWRGPELAAVIPMQHGPRNALEPLANDHTPLFRPVYDDPAALRHAVEAVLARSELSFRLDAVPLNDPALSVLDEQATRARRPRTIEHQHTSPIVDTHGSFESWRELTRPRWRTDLDRFRRNLHKRFAAEFRIVAPPSDLTAELQRGFQVEASGWKGQSASAILSSPRTAGFYEDVARSFHERGQLRLSHISVQGSWAAFDLCLLHGSRLYLLKTGYDEQFRNRAPGLVLRLATIERCFELDLDAHELLGGDTEWKRRFATDQREHASFHCYSRRPLSVLRWTYRAGMRPAAKRLYHAARDRGERHSEAPVSQR